MPILPIDNGRYGTQEMSLVFDEESRLQRLLDVEAALAWAQAEVGDIPRLDAEGIMEMASVNHVKLDRVKEIELEIKHDVMSVVRALAEVSGSSGAYVHLGATSSDILDTATALQLRDALRLIEEKLNGLEEVLMKGANRYKKTMMMGRTHGQHALPITFGLKLAVWMREIARHSQRLRECSSRVLVGKMTGAVGTQAGLGPHATEIQGLVMERLNLRPVEVSTQIVQRDRLAELICLLSIVASTLDKIATEIRELQRPEIGEIFEFFERKKQVGSSTMPHKHDPQTCETVCGLAKIMRSLVVPALENVPTWHERDMTQSSAERFLIPEACILIDHMLISMTRVLATLQVDEERMMKNMDITQGRMMSEVVMLALAGKDMDRQKAHEIIRRLAMRSYADNRFFKQVLLEDDTVHSILSEEEIDEALDPRNYLGTATWQVEMAVEKTKLERKARGLSG
ncbi:MAG: adenylosuccinate lyase [Candidatus Bathyarchaeota archaeon]|nr:MAG: adenylosuccinate lyase [Candidatus Bathyarchaeota archaeon]